MTNRLKKLTTFFCLALTQIAAAADTRPNIVFILSDDQAWTDYGFMGHPDIKTPHLDKLADRSVVFERGYVAAPSTTQRQALSIVRQRTNPNTPSNNWRTGS